MLKVSSRVAAAAVLLGCSSDSSGSGGPGSTGAEGPDVEVITAPFDQTLGAAPTKAWTIAPFRFHACWTPAPDGNVLVVDGMGIFDKLGSDGKSNWAKPLPVPSFSVCTFAVTKDSGAVLTDLAQTGTFSHHELTRIGGDGTVKWSHTIANAPSVNDSGAIAVLSSGVIATAFQSAIDGASDALLVTAPMAVGLFDDKDGHEIARTEIPYVHVDSVDNTGDGAGDGLTPGTGKPRITVIASTPDGGFVVGGQYVFYRYIACGSEDNPQRPDATTMACGNANDDALVARFDATGKLLWSTRIGAPYATPDMTLGDITMLADGSVLAVGTITSKAGVHPDPYIQALAIRVDASGKATWAKAFPWGGPPGTHFLDGGGSFSTLSATADGGVDMVLHPPKGVPCRFVHMDANGAFNRVQTLVAKPYGFETCSTRTANGSLYVRDGEDSLSKLVP